MNKIKSYKDLLVWQKSMDFSVLIYKETLSFPESEKFGITNQLRRASVSIPSNIAEGFGRQSSGDYARFLRIAYGSTLEVLTQLEISFRIGFISELKFKEMQSNGLEIERMMYSLIKKVKANKGNHNSTNGALDN